MMYTTEDFVSKMTMHFYPPQKWDEAQEKAWADTIDRELSTFAGPVLKGAADTIVRTRKEGRLPLVSECIAACLEARRALGAEERKGQLPIGPAESGGDWSAERLKLAYELCHTELGRQAARMGWALRLWNFCRKEQRHPKPMEIEKLKKEAAEHKKLVAECHAGKGGAVSAALAKLGDSMLAKEQRLVDEVLHGVVR